MHLNTKKIAFAGVMLETNTLFLLAAASFFVGIVIQEFGLKSGAGFLLAGILLGIFLSPNKLYVVSYAFMGFYILIIETIWHFSGRASGWLLYSDNLYFLSLTRRMNMQWGKSGKKIDINSGFKAYIVQ